MLSGNFIIVFIGLVVAGFVFCNFKMSTKEGFLGGLAARSHVFQRPNYRSRIVPRHSGGLDLNSHVYEHRANSKAYPEHPVSEGYEQDMNSLELDNILPYTRTIYANKSNRLRGRGDLLRGDIKISAPPSGLSGGEWMRPVPDHNGLHEGALNVLAGVEHETRPLEQHMYKESGGTYTTMGGADLTHNLEQSTGLEHNLNVSFI
jgi:hypothetical protein